MIVCKKCGSQEGDDVDFCGSCGAFLEFTGERVQEPEPQAPPVEEVVLPDEQRGVVATVKHVIGIEAKERERAESERAQALNENEEARRAAEREAEDQSKARAEAELQARAAARSADDAEIQATIAAQSKDDAVAEAEAAAAAQQRAAETAETQRLAAEEARARSGSASTGDEETQAGIDAEARAAEIAADQARSAAVAEARKRDEAEQRAKVAKEEEERARLRAEVEAKAIADAAQRAEVAAAAEAAARAEAEERAKRAAALVAPPAVSNAGQAEVRTSQLSDTGERTPPAVISSAPQPEAVLPGATRARPGPLKKTQPQRQARPGDLICGQCGEPNSPERRFCRRCGQSLQEAVIVRVGWWRRHFSRKRTPTPAGTRHQARSGSAGAGVGRRSTSRLKGILKKVVPLALVALVVLAVVPGKNPIKTWRQKVQREIHPTFVEVHPVQASATSAAPGHPASNAIDGLSNTAWWAAPSANDGVGQVLTITFSGTTAISRIGFLSGASEAAADFTAEPRPSGLEVTFLGPSGSVLPGSTTVTLQDAASFQVLTFHAEGVHAIALKVTSVYPGISGSDVAITEVEPFFEQN